MVLVEFFQFVVFFFVIVTVVVGVGAIVVVGGGGIHVFEGVQPNGGTVFGRVVVFFCGLFPYGLAFCDDRNDGALWELATMEATPKHPLPTSWPRSKL